MALHCLEARLADEPDGGSPKADLPQIAPRPTHADHSVEEYKTLRAEMLRAFDAMERNVLICLTANSFIVGYGIAQGQSIVLFLAIPIPLYFWIQHSNLKLGVAKMSAYISQPEVGNTGPQGGRG